jgi:hypothetical protein
LTARSFSVDINGAATAFLVALAFVWALIVIATLIDSNTAYDSANVVVPLFIMFASGSVAWQLVTRSRRSLLTPLPMAFAFVSLLFGLGPLLHAVLGDSTYVTANFRIPLDASNIFRVQVLNLVGVSFLALGMLVAAACAGRLGPRSVSPRAIIGGQSEKSLVTKRGSDGQSMLSDKALLQGYLVFTVVAAAVRGMHRVFDINPMDFAPGFLNVIDRAGLVAVLFGAMLAGRRGRLFWLLLAVPLTLEVAQGFLNLRKSNVLIPLVVCFLGLHLGGRSVRVIVLGVALSLGIFVVIYPLINSGRDLVWSQGDTTSLQYFSDALSNRSTATIGEVDLWSAWSRLNFTPVQHALMQEYDENRAGKTFSQLPWMFIPRFLAPQKPILNFGAGLTDILFGHQHSSTAPTLFGEAYWNGGWLCVVWSAFAAGLILSFVSLTCLWLFAQQSLLAWPIGMLGILTGQLLENFFTSGLVATSAAFFCLALLVALTIKLSPGTRSRWNPTPSMRTELGPANEHNYARHRLSGR